MLGQALRGLLTLARVRGPLRGRLHFPQSLPRPGADFQSMSTLRADSTGLCICGMRLYTALRVVFWVILADCQPTLLGRLAAKHRSLYAWRGQGPEQAGGSCGLPGQTAKLRATHSRQRGAGEKEAEKGARVSAI